MRPITKIATVIVSLLLLFLLVGYLYSDTRHFKDLIKKNNLHTPGAVFTWLRSNYGYVNPCQVVHVNAGPLHLLNSHKHFFCDEGATVMATLVHQSGYETRLVNLLGRDKVAHHTILQVKENSSWVNYDFTYGLIGQDISKSATYFELDSVLYMKYPNTYHFFVNNNWFLKQTALRLRGIKEDGGSSCSQTCD